MSDRTVRWALAVAAVALIGAPAAAQAQQTRPEQEQALRRHLDSIMPLLAQAESEAKAGAARRAEEERRRSAPVTDTFAVGPVRVVTLPSQRAEAEELFREVWDGEYGSFVSESPALSRMTFTFEWATPLEPIYVDGDVRRVELGRWKPRSDLVAGIRQAISTTILHDLDGTKVGAWAPRPVAATPDGAMIYRSMVGNLAHVDRDCLAGVADACWKALGLGLSANPLADWYTPEERRALVASITSMPFSSVPNEAEELKAMRHACVDEKIQSSCDSFLTGGWMAGRMPAMPLSFTTPVQLNGAHAELVWLALEAGGAGAWDRLREHPDMTPEEALTYASGLTPDQLAAKWQQWLVEQQPPQRAVLDPSLLFTLLWVAALAALAMRNTRWRLG